MDNQLESKSAVLQLGMKVISKKTGLPGTGMAVGFICPMYFSITRNGQEMPRWDEVCPDWKLKPLVLVVMENSQRHLSYEEYLAQSGGMDTPYCRLAYNMIPTSPMQTFPYDDLEPYGD